MDDIKADIEARLAEQTKKKEPEKPKQRQFTPLETIQLSLLSSIFMGLGWFYLLQGTFK